MRHIACLLTSVFLLFVSSQEARCGTPPLPPKSPVIQGYDIETAKQRLDELPLQPIEGLWRYLAEGMTLAIEQFSDKECPDIGYRVIMVECDDMSVLPGTVIGYVTATPLDNKWHLWLYSQRSRLTLCEPLECVATLSSDDAALTFEPPHWKVKLRINFARFLPSIFKGLSIIPEVAKEKEPVGFRKIYPADGNGNKFAKVRYL